MREEEIAQAYKTDGDYLTSTPTVRLAAFESYLLTLQQFGGGDVIFQGGKGFVRFRIREDGNIVVLVPVSASIPRVPCPLHSARFFVADKSQIPPYSSNASDEEATDSGDETASIHATEREVAYPGTAPHI